MKEQLKSVIRQARQGGVTYGEFILEAKKRYVLEVINAKDVRGNQCKAARELEMHRNTFRRTTQELALVKSEHGSWMNLADYTQSRKRVTNVKNASSEALEA
jgi:Fis family transcriptional regulator, factor for inversion stimulation protein